MDCQELSSEKGLQNFSIMTILRGLQFISVLSASIRKYVNVFLSEYLQ
jgi:hypothetical protein